MFWSGEERDSADILPSLYQRLAAVSLVEHGASKSSAEEGEDNRAQGIINPLPHVPLLKGRKASIRMGTNYMQPGIALQTFKFVIRWVSRSVAIRGEEIPPSDPGV